MTNGGQGARLDREQLWSTWRQLTAEFGFKRLAGHLIKSKSGWGIYEVDVVSTLIGTPMALAVRDTLSAQDLTQLQALLGIVRLNAARNDSLWKMAALFYVSGPVTLVLSGFQIAPKFTRDVLTIGAVGFTLVALSLMASLFWYYTINWRAGQVAAVIELELIERGQVVSPANAPAA